MVVLPSLGPLHLTQPRYNAVSLLRQIERHSPKVVYLASYSPEGLAQKVWRDQNDLALFELEPWATRADVGLVALGDRAEALQAEAEHFLEYLGSMPRGEDYKEKFRAADRSLLEYLTVPRLPQDFSSEEVVAELRQRVNAVRDLAGEGPATGFRAERMEQVAARLLEVGSSDAVVIVDVLDYPELLARLPKAEGPVAVEPNEAERARAVMDRAWRLEEDDAWGNLIGQLMELRTAEARFLASQVYLAAGQVDDALVLLEEVAKADFSRPEYLPGYVLARLGQLYDLTGQRDRALRAYRGVLALSWVPAEARELAMAGVRTPFRSSPEA
jgi:tetratricopeptide (TPR) repeat protein